MVEALFVLSLLGIFYSYALYPALLLLLPDAPPARRDAAGGPPFVSIIIAAHNEQARIAAKLDNTLALFGDAARREIIVASDASTDETDDIVRRYVQAGHPVTLVPSVERKGKEHAQAQAIARARGDIFVFTDVSTMLPPEAIERLLANFADPRVGAVSSEDRFLMPSGEVAGEGVYVKYEMWLRRLESRRGGVVGLSGSFFAARREVCTPWDTLVPSDFNTALNCARQGYLAVSDPRVLGYYANIRDERREYARKVRTVTRGIAAVWRHPDILNPFVFGLFAFKVWSHKIMRWAVPWFLVLALGTSLLLSAQHWVYRGLFLLQVFLYGLALLPALRGVGVHGVFKIPYFFVQVNLAIAHATLAFLLGRRVTVWEPSKR